MRHPLLLAAGLLPLTAWAAPDAPRPRAGCGIVDKFRYPSQDDYQKARVDDWLDLWIQSEWVNGTSRGRKQGLTATLGEWALGSDYFTCLDNGNDANCDMNECGNKVLNSKDPDEARNVYYVLRSIQNLHAYFEGMNEAFLIGSVSAAFAKDSWANIFYDGKDANEGAIAKQILNVVATLFGIAGGAAALVVKEAAAAGTAIAATIMGGSITSVYHALQSGDGEGELISNQIGQTLADLTLFWAQTRIQGNNELMKGRTFGDLYLDDYLKGGFWVDYPGVDKSALAQNTFSTLKAIAINEIWKLQKIFIIGGGSCDDSDGFGQGNSGTDNGAYAWCDTDNNQAWYLYYWQNGDFNLPTDKGWMARPWGADALGAGDFADVTARDVIISSLKSYRAAGFDYTNDVFRERYTSAYVNGHDPFSEGPQMEGLFTVPVCDFSSVVAKKYNFPNREYVLQPYGYDKRSNWCTPICGGDLETSWKFLDRAHLSESSEVVFGCPGCKTGCGSVEDFWKEHKYW
ncbi:hypothetical protein FQN50_006325 [Emmonsiellopsis sp. PD_5]|nr:hypothetical protein FQN50_006325 [Emmonsiellopsis sp. PD_5]